MSVFTHNLEAIALVTLACTTVFCLQLLCMHAYLADTLYAFT